MMITEEKKDESIKEVHEKKNVPIVSFLSGKGGVGKTTFSVNLTKILSGNDKNKVLLVDCDFINRGASSLLIQEVNEKNCTLYSMLLKELKSKGEDCEKGSIQNIETDNFFFLPSTETAQLIDWIEYKANFEKLKNVLKCIIEKIVKEYNIDCVVFDCRPGPDPLSVAAASISDFVILMTEADKVTFDGTMHLRHHISEKYKVDKNVYFIINRVPEKYNNSDINDFYPSSFLSILNIEILSVVPFEYEIFESLGEENFVIEQYPGSNLSRKLHILAYDLFNKEFPHLLTPKIESLGKSSDKFRNTIKVRNDKYLYLIPIALIIAGIFLIKKLMLLEDFNLAVLLFSIYGVIIIISFIILYSNRFSKIRKKR